MARWVQRLSACCLPFACGALLVAPAQGTETPGDQLQQLRDQSRKVREGLDQLHQLQDQRRAALRRLPSLKRQARSARILAAQAQATYARYEAQAQAANNRLNSVTLRYIQTLSSMTWSQAGMEGRIPELSQMASSTSMHDAALVYGQAQTIMNDMQFQMDEMRALASRAADRQQRAEAARTSAQAAQLSAAQALLTQHQLEAALRSSAQALRRNVSVDQSQLAATFNRLLDSGAELPGVDTSALGLPTAQRIVALATREWQKGVREEPLGSNMSPDITRYLTATEGSVRGAAWCAYFVSYITRRAGVPIGDGGSGLGYVGDITAWGQSVQRYFPSGSTRYRPQPGDIILWNPNHIGLVVQNRGSSVVTIEGNASDRVNRLTRSVASATGFIRLAGPRLGRSDGASGGGANLGNIL